MKFCASGMAVGDLFFLLCVLSSLSSGETEKRVSIPCVVPKSECDPHLAKKYRDEDDKIIGGKVAEPGTTPWLASLQDLKYGDPTHFCGATILSHSWVLTSALCVEGYNYPYTDLEVVAGEYDLSEDEDCEQRRIVTRIEIHPSYDPFTLDYNVALLKVLWFRYTERVAPMPLPPSSSFPIPHYDTKACGTGLIAGWGLTSDEGEPSHLVLVANTPLLTKEECAVVYEGDITDSMMCAGNLTHGGVDPCNGDWGGPLRDDKGYLIGVASWSPNCGSPQTPGVYTDVARIRSWICDFMNCSH